MSKVKNKKVIRKIADKTRKAKKSKNIIAVFAIALTALLFTSLFTVGGSIVEKQQESTMRQVGGSAHAGYKYLTQAEYDIVKQDKKLKEVSYRILVGDAVNDELKKLRTEISYYEDLDAKFSFCYPEKGHMPEKEDEIVTSDLVLEEMGIPCKLGQKVPLEIKVNEKVVKKTFTLCGYFKGDTISQVQVAAVSKEYANKVAPTPVTSAMETTIDSSDYAGRIQADFNFRSSWQLEKQLEELTGRLGFPESANTGVNWAYMGMDLDIGVVLLIAVLLLVIAASGYLIIYNIFYINVYRDIRHYGLLKTIGTTGKQLKKIVRRQAYMLSLYGIPIGLILGAVVARFLMPAIVGTLTFSGTTDGSVTLKPWIFIGAAVFSLLTVYISCIKPCKIASQVTAVEAVRYTEGQETAGQVKQRKKLFGRQKEAVKHDKTERKTGKGGRIAKKVTPRQLAVLNVRRNKKRVIVVVASLSMALVLLNCIYSFVQGFDMDKFASSMTVSDFSVADATIDNLAIDFNARVVDGVTKDFQDKLVQQKGIEEIGNVYVKEFPPTFTDGDWAKLNVNVFENPDAKQTIEEQVQWLGEDWFNQSIENRDLDGKVYGIGKLVMEKLENTEGELDWEKFRTGKYVIASRFGAAEDENSGFAYFKVGEKVTVYNEQGESRKYEVLAVADMPYACSTKYYGGFECNYILPEEEYLDFCGEQQPMRTLFNVKKDRRAAVEEWLTDYCTNVNDDLDFTSKSKIVQEFDTTKNMYSMVGGLLAFILAVIGILNFVNTMITSVISRKQEIAMMEAVGMTGKQQKEMLVCEGLCYAVLTGIVSIILSALLSVTAVKNIGSSFFFFTWRFTILPVVLCLPFLAAVVFLVPWACHKQMRKTSVVERIRRDE